MPTRSMAWTLSKKTHWLASCAVSSVSFVIYGSVQASLVDSTRRVHNYHITSSVMQLCTALLHFRHSMRQLCIYVCKSFCATVHRCMLQPCTRIHVLAASTLTHVRQTYIHTYLLAD